MIGSTYRGMTRILAVLMIVLGAGMLVRTLRDGVGVGVILGLLFVAAGAARLWLLRRT